MSQELISTISAVDVKERIQKFISKGTKYVALVEPPLPDDNALYIKYQDGRIQEAFSSTGSISIFDAQRELKERIETGQVLSVEEGIEDIDGETRAVLYLKYLNIEKKVEKSGKIEKITFSSKGFYVEATVKGLLLEVSYWTNGKTFWDKLRVQIEQDPNNAELPLFFKSEREAERVTLLDLINAYLYPLYNFQSILREAVQ